MASQPTNRVLGNPILEVTDAKTQAVSRALASNPRQLYGLQAGSLANHRFWSRTCASMWASSLRSPVASLFGCTAVLSLTGWYTTVHPVFMRDASYAYLRDFQIQSVYTTDFCLAVIFAALLLVLWMDRVNVRTCLRWLAVINRWNHLAERLGVPSHIIRITYNKFPAVSGLMPQQADPGDKSVVPQQAQPPQEWKGNR